MQIFVMIKHFCVSYKTPKFGFIGDENFKILLCSVREGIWNFSASWIVHNNVPLADNGTVREDTCTGSASKKIQKMYL